jgi:hypothetical protein
MNGWLDPRRKEDIGFMRPIPQITIISGRRRDEYNINQAIADIYGMF